MTFVFYFPLVLSVVGTLFFLFCTDLDLKWKILAIGMTGISLLLQWVPQFEVHFLIPLILQALVSIWVVIYFQLE